MRRFFDKNARRLKRQQGIGLVELLVSATIGLIIMLGVTQLFVSSRETSANADAMSRIQENMRYAMQRIGDDIYRAGNMGCMSFVSAGFPSLTTNPDLSPDTIEGQYIYNRLFIDSNVDGVADVNLQHRYTAADAPLITSPSDDDNISDFEGSFISGVDNDAVANDILNGTDSLIVKYVDVSSESDVVSVPNDTEIVVAGDFSGLAAGSVVFAGDCDGISVFNVGTVTTAINAGGSVESTITMLNGTTAPFLSHMLSELGRPNLFFYTGDSGSYEYYIGQGVAALGACDAANPLNCSLYRRENGVSRELVLGVSNLQVSYGQEGVVALTDTLPANRLAVSRVQVQMVFNAGDFSQADNEVSRTYTRVFAVRNRL